MRESEKEKEKEKEEEKDQYIITVIYDKIGREQNTILSIIKIYFKTVWQPISTLLC